MSVLKFNFLAKKNHVKHLKSIFFSEVVEAIKSGNINGINFAPLISKIRNEPDHDERTKLKNELPAIACNEFDNYLADEHGISFSAAIFDVDIFNPATGKGIPLSQIETEYEKTKKIPEVYALWKSPSGGFKFLVRFAKSYKSKDPKTWVFYKAVYQWTAQTFFGLTNLDKSCSDMRRICYLSHDPDIWINPEPVLIDITTHISAIKTIINTTPKETEEPLPKGVKKGYSDQQLSEAAEFLIGTIKGTEQIPGNPLSYDDYIDIGFALKDHGELGKELFYKIALSDGRDTRQDIDEKWRSFKSKDHVRKVTIGTFIKFVKDLGWTPKAFKKSDDRVDPVKLNSVITKKFKDKLAGRKAEKIFLFYERGQASMLYGLGGSQKTWYAMCIGWSASLGHTILGIEKPSKPFKVIFFEFEDSLAFFQKKYLLSQGITEEALDKNKNFILIDSATLSDEGLPYQFAECPDVMEDLIKMTQADFVIIDHTKKMGKNVPDDNSNSREFMSDLQEIAKRQNCHIMFLHHEKKVAANSKPIENDDSKLFYGSQSFWDMSREAVHAKTFPDKMWTSAFTPKKHAVDYGSIVQTLHPTGIDGDEWSRVDVTHELVYKEEKKSEVLGDTILNILLQDKNMMVKDIKNKILQGNVSKTSFYRAIEDLVEKKFVVKEILKSKGSPIQLHMTEAGETYIVQVITDKNAEHDKVVALNRFNNEEDESEIIIPEVPAPLISPEVSMKKETVKVSTKRELSEWEKEIAAKADIFKIGKLSDIGDLPELNKIEETNKIVEDLLSGLDLSK